MAKRKTKDTRPNLTIVTDVKRSRIEKGIPLPESRGGKQAMKFPELHTMDIGDSIRVREERETLSSACAYAKLKRGFRFTIRKDGDGFRVWRTA
jgi:hypothetical protein